MATSHFVRTVHKQSGGSTVSVQRCLYIQREGQYAPLDYVTGQANPQGREDLIHTQPVNLPDWAHGSATTYFATASAQERANGIVSAEWKLSLPRELSRAQQLTAAAHFLSTQLGTTHPYVWAMHEPPASDHQANPHVHCIFSSRTLDGIETRSPEQFFRRYNPAHPERGGAPKDSSLHAFGAVKDQRRAYTDVMNLHLEFAGSAARLHPDRLSARGFEREPEPRAWPSDSYELKHNQKVTTTWQAVLDHRQHHQGKHVEELEDARQYWTERKAVLGITERTPHAVALERIATARPPRQRSRGALEHEALGIQQHVTALEHHREQLTAALAVERVYSRIGRPLPDRRAVEHDALLSEGQALGISRAPQLSKSLLQDRAAARERQASRERQPSPVVTRAREVLQGLSLGDDVSGPGLQVRLRDKDHEQEHDRGMGW